MAPAYAYLVNFSFQQIKQQWLTLSATWEDLRLPCNNCVLPQYERLLSEMFMSVTILFVAHMSSFVVMLLRSRFSSPMMARTKFSSEKPSTTRLTSTDGKTPSLSIGSSLHTLSKLHPRPLRLHTLLPRLK